MDFLEAMVAMAEPGARVALVPDLLRTGLAEMVVTGDLPVWPAMAATVPMVTRRPLMAEQVEREAMSALRELEEPAAREEGVPQAEQAVRTEPPRHPAAMVGTAAMDLLRCSQATLEAMAETVEPVDLSATAAMGDSAAMAQSGRLEQLGRHPEIQAPMAHSAEQAVAAGPAEPAEQFQAMAVMVASRATAELEVTAEPASQARTG